MTITTAENGNSHEIVEQKDLYSILEAAKEAAKLAGAAIQRAIHSVDNNDMTTKSNAVDLVTGTDHKAEELIIQYLKTKYPSHKIIGEESSGADCRYELTDEPTWTIDPIDGTTNFVHKLEGWSCVLIAFLQHQQVQVGVTYNPANQELFWAIRGQGAHLETSRSGTRLIYASPCKTIQTALIATDPGYGRDSASIHRFQSVQSGLLQAGVRNIRIMGCSGLCLAHVACGRFDAFFEEGSWQSHTGPKIWDLAAGKLLVEEAGGMTRHITDRASKDKPMDLMQRSSFVAATPELADQILEIMYTAK